MEKRATWMFCMKWKQAAALFILILILFQAVAASAIAKEIPPEDRAELGSLPALSWGETGVEVEAWIHSFAGYLKKYGWIEAPDSGDFRVRAYSEDACMFRSARLGHLEIFLGIRDGDDPLLVGVSIHPTPDLGELPVNQRRQALNDYSLVMHACAYANIRVLGDVDTEDEGDVIHALCRTGLHDMVALRKDVEEVLLQPGVRGISTEYSLRYEADMGFLTFGCDYKETQK